MSKSHSRVPFLVLPALLALAGAACQAGPDTRSTEPSGSERPYLLERVGDAAVVQLYADGFDNLETRDRVLVYHLYQAALAGRDIYYRQKCTVGVEIRDLLEEILTHPRGVDPGTLEAARIYAKLLWINSSPYDSITSRKFVLDCTPVELARAAEAAQAAGARLPLAEGETARGLVRRLHPVLFDPGFEPMLTAKNPEAGVDVLEASAVTFYGKGVEAKDFEGFEERYELNSTVVATSIGLVEEPWRLGHEPGGIQAGHFAAEIAVIVGHLEAAMEVAPPPTRRALEALVRFYRTGAPSDRVAYDIAWVADTESPVDTVNGFVEVYLDPRGKKGSWEGIVSYEDPVKAALIQSIAAQAQWFEDHMPYDDAFKKKNVQGISARSIDVVIETGDAGPVSAIGINLPNDQFVREHHGSKSVSLANVIEAYERSGSSSSRAEFCFDELELARAEKWTSLTGDLLVNMHEVIGHASGRMADDRQGDPADWIGEYYSALEEGRSDLIALYFVLDPKLVELGLVDDAADLEEVALTAYENYTRNGGLLQLRRIRQGDQIEEDHMRNRQLVVRWILENSDAIEQVERDGKTYLRVRDARAWREAAGRLLAIVQRIKSTGDYEAAKELFDAYGIRFDPALRDEVLERYSTLDVPAYTGFVMPRLSPVLDAEGAVVDAHISYPLSLETQMLEWSGRLPAPTRE